MGIAADFRETFEGISFHLIEFSGGVARFKSDFIVIPEQNIEVFCILVVSLKDYFTLPDVILIEDIYNCSTKIHDISQFQNIPFKTHNLFKTDEKAI